MQLLEKERYFCGSSAIIKENVSANDRVAMLPDVCVNLLTDETKKTQLQSTSCA